MSDETALRLGVERPAADASPAVAGRRRWILVVTVIAAALLVTGAVTQAVTPFIRLDDFTYMVPEGTTGVPNVWRRNLLEGRWLTYAWWLVIGQHGTAFSASMMYVTAYVVLVAGLWRVLHLGLPRLHWGVDALLGLSVFVSPVWVKLFYWPATLTASTVVGAAALWLLPLAARRRAWLVVWMATATVLSVLSYPPVGVVVFLAAVVFLARRPWQELFWLTGAFLGGFALGVGIMNTLNLLAFDRFGLEISAWRRPNPPHDLGDLRVNAGRFRRHAGCSREGAVAARTGGPRSRARGPVGPGRAAASGATARRARSRPRGELRPGPRDRRRDGHEGRALGLARGPLPRCPPARRLSGFAPHRARLPSRAHHRGKLGVAKRAGGPPEDACAVCRHRRRGHPAPS